MMTPLPEPYSTNNQLMALETCLHAVIQEGFHGLHTVKVALSGELCQLLNAEITILLDQPKFVLIIHNHREKLAVLGHVQPRTTSQYDITLDGHTVNSGPDLMAVINRFM
ncbi:hypothetical protein LAPL110952_06980 [Lactiplantibacillus plajomi]